MKLVIERAPWHTVRDLKPRFRYDAIVTAHGVTMRTCRLSDSQVKKLTKAGVEVVRVPCKFCERIACICCEGREPRRHPPRTHTPRKK